MKTIKRMGAQGDVMFIRVTALPAGLSEVQAVEGRCVVAHSETGHDHYTASSRARQWADPQDPLICYLQVSDEYADIVHARSFDTHETIRLGAGTWRTCRQREYVPGGFRRVED